MELVDGLRAGSRQSGGSRHFRTGTEALVAGQLALALVVLSAAALVGRSLLAMEHVDLAFDASRLLIVDLTFPVDPSSDMKRQVALLDQLVPLVEAVPGVRSATPVLTPPFAAAGGVFGRIPAEGQTSAEAARNPIVDYEIVTPNFFSTFGMPLVRGRLFTGEDREGTLPVVVIGEALARHFWPNEDPIGKRLVDEHRSDKKGFFTVVGVVRDARYRDIRESRPRVYIPLRQSFFPIVPTTLVIATGGEAVHPADLVPAVRRAVNDAGLGLGVAGAAPFVSYLDGLLAQPRLNALLLALFAGAALSLAAVGLFGAMTTAVRQRTREIGVRVALGATPADVRRLVLDRALVIAGVGITSGLLAALASNQLVRSLLFSVSPTDVPTLALTSVLLLAVALIAAHLPARRAVRIEPAQTLRAE